MQNLSKVPQSHFVFRNNSFDVARLVLSLLVVYGHSWLLGGYGSGDLISKFSKGQASSGDLAVLGFCALSGYLITSSFLKIENKGLKGIIYFCLNRIMRIFPGFWLALFFTAFIFAPLIVVFTDLPQDSWSASDAIVFLKKFFIENQSLAC